MSRVGSESWIVITPMVSAVALSVAPFVRPLTQPSGVAARRVACSALAYGVMSVDQTETDPGPPLVRPRFSFSEAAKLTRTSRSTIKRRHAAGSFPHAERDETGAWTIPIEDLLAVGLVPSDRPPPLGEATDQDHDDVTRGRDPGLDAELLAELADLRHDLALERARREAAERVAAERAEHLDTVRLALRMLEAGPGAVAVSDGAVFTPGESPPPRRRRWWQPRPM